MELQKNIKDNAEDLRGIVNEMSTWEKEMKRKENSLLENENADTCDVIFSLFLFFYLLQSFIFFQLFVCYRIYHPLELNSGKKKKT